jgi:hypothetical protein
VLLTHSLNAAAISGAKSSPPVELMRDALSALAPDSPSAIMRGGITQGQEWAT